MIDERYGISGINEELGPYGAKLNKNYVEFETGEKMPIAVAPLNNTYSLNDVSEIAKVVQLHGKKHGKHWGKNYGRKEGKGDLGKLAYKLSQQPVTSPWEKREFAIASIFAISFASFVLLIFTNNAPTGAVVGSSSASAIGLKLTVGLVVVISTFFLSKIIKNRK